MFQEIPETVYVCRRMWLEAAIFWPVVFSFLPKMTRYVALSVYRFLADFPTFDHWLGKWAQWLLELNPSDVRNLKLAI
jgi:hypothetical protein